MKKILIITSLLIGILLSLQIRSFKKVEFLIQRSDPRNILTELRTFQIANAELRTKLSEEGKALQDMNSKIAKKTVDEEIRQLRLLAARDSIFGEGIEISLNSRIKAFWITDLIAHLVGTGAEAIAINGYRLTEGTAGLRDVGNGFLIRQEFLRPPFNITVIGPRNDLQRAISQTGGIIERMKKAAPGLNVTITQKDRIIIPALRNLP